MTMDDRIATVIGRLVIANEANNERIEQLTTELTEIREQLETLIAAEQPEIIEAERR